METLPQSCEHLRKLVSVANFNVTYYTENNVTGLPMIRRFLMNIPKLTYFRVYLHGPNASSSVFGSPYKATSATYP